MRPDWPNNIGATLPEGGRVERAAPDRHLLSSSIRRIGVSARLRNDSGRMILLAKRVAAVFETATVPVSVHRGDVANDENPAL